MSLLHLYPRPTPPAVPMTAISGARRSPEAGLLRLLVLRLTSQHLGAPVGLWWDRHAWARWSLAKQLYVWQTERRLVRHQNLPPRGYMRWAWQHGVLVLALSIYLGDPHLLLSWLRARLRQMSLYRHRRFFRVLGLLFRQLLPLYFGPGRVVGVYVYLVGKISAVGNAMSRSYLLRVGKTPNASLALRASSVFHLVRTSTGCLGMTMVYYRAC